MTPAAPPPPSGLAVPLEQAPTLLKLQAPIESFRLWINGHLLHWFPGAASFLWVLHLLVAISLTIVGAWLLGAVIGRLGAFAERRGQRLLSQILKFSAPTVRWVLLFAGIADAVEDTWPAVKGPLRWLAGALFIIAAVIGTRGVVRLSRAILDYVLRPVLLWPDTFPDLSGTGAGHTPTSTPGSEPSSERDGLSTSRRMSRDAGASTMIALIQRLFSMVLWLSGLIVVLDHFGQNISSVVAALGVTSLAIGLASQQALSNIIASLVLALDHPFRVGDRVKLASGEGGEVLEIGMRATQIRLVDGSLLFVPNAELVSTRLVNQTQGDAVRAEVRLTVPVSLDVERLSADLLDEVQRLEPAALERPRPRINLLSVADKVELSIVLWLPRHANAEVPRLEDTLRRAALRRLQAILPPPSATPTAASATGSPATAPPMTPSSGPGAQAR